MNRLTAFVFLGCSCFLLAGCGDGGLTSPDKNDISQFMADNPELRDEVTAEIPDEASERIDNAAIDAELAELGE